MQKQPIIDRSITSQNGLCAKIKTQDSCYLFYFYFQKNKINQRLVANLKVCVRNKANNVRSQYAVAILVICFHRC